MGYYDFVCPQGNELNFIEVADAFSYSDLFFCYNLNDFYLSHQEVDASEMYSLLISYYKEKIAQINSLQDHATCKLHPVFIVSKELDAFFLKSKKKFFSSFKKIILLRSVSIDEDFRIVLENSFCSIFYGLESHNKIDFIHHRNSGFNNVIAKILTDSNNWYSFNMSNSIGYSLDNEKKRYSSGRSLGRMNQNARICIKYKTPLLVMSFAKHWNEMYSYRDMISFFALENISKTYFEDSINLFFKQFSFLRE